MIKRFLLCVVLAACAAPGISGAQNVPSPSLAPLVKRLKPAVVNIFTTKVVRHGGDPHFRGDPFRDFFRRFLPNPHGRGMPERRQRGQGSGFIISSDGYVVTNNHVVSGADEVKVKLDNGEAYDAKVVGRDPSTDVALIKIKGGKRVPVLELGDSDKLEVGDWVFAIGNPFGLSHTVTAGIVSAKDRYTGGSYDEFIQTDAAINPGNSGGPLFNLKGEVVGINAQILGPGANIGIGFAIPINLARSVIDQLREKGKVVRGYLGLTYQPLDGPTAKALGLKEAEGALVRSVVAGGPADKAGVKEGDVIVQFEGKRDKIGERLARLVGNVKPGTKVRMAVWRNKSEKKLQIKLDTRPSEEELASRRQSPGMGDPGAFGVTVMPTKGRGVEVTGVAPGSPAMGYLEPGDIVIEVNRQPVNSPAEFTAAIGRLRPGEVALVRIERDGGMVFLAIPTS